MKKPAIILASFALSGIFPTLPAQGNGIVETGLQVPLASCGSATVAGGDGEVSAADTTAGVLYLSLDDCRELALQYNEDLRKAGISLEQAEQDKKAAIAAYFPTVSGSFMGLYASDTEILTYTLELKGTYLAGVNLQLPLYAGGRIRYGNKLARIGVEAAGEQLEQARVQVIADTDNAYWTLISVQSKVRMLEAYMEQLEELAGYVNSSVELGFATDTDLLKVKTSQSDILYQLQKARNGEVLCRLSLCSTLGLSLDTEIVPVDTVLTVTAPELYDEDVSERPEYRLLEKQIEASEQQVKLARADYLPTIGLAASYSYYDNIKMKGTVTISEMTVPITVNFNDISTMAMLSVKLPILDWGANAHKIRKAKLGVTAAELDLQKNARLLTMEVRQASQNLTSSYMMVETAELGLEHARMNLEAVRSRYEMGFATLNELLDAQTQWQQSVSNEIEAKTQYLINGTEYLRCLGRL